LGHGEVILVLFETSSGFAIFGYDEVKLFQQGAIQVIVDDSILFCSCTCLVVVFVINLYFFLFSIPHRIFVSVSSRPFFLLYIAYRHFRLSSGHASFMFVTCFIEWRER
jgi:hypothetical protein